MSRKLLAVAVMSVPVAFAPAALAHGSNRDHFVHRATGYYVTTQSNGREMCLEGTNPRTGQTFSLHRSASGEVTGTFEGRQVSFTVDRDSRAR